MEICFSFHEKTRKRFLRNVPIRNLKITGKEAGIYERKTNAVVLFLDALLMASVQKVKTAETSEEIKRNLPKIAARILCQELGHAKEKIDFQQIAEEILKDRRAHVPIPRAIPIKKAVKKRKALSEKATEEFAEQYGQNIESLFVIEES